MKKLALLLVIPVMLLSLSFNNKPMANSPIGYYKTYDDYLNNNLIEVRNFEIKMQVHMNRSKHGIAYVTNRSAGINKFIYGKDIWGLKIGECLYRTIQSRWDGEKNEKYVKSHFFDGRYNLGLLVKVVSEGEYIYYENGGQYINICNGSQKDYSEFNNNFIKEYSKPPSDQHDIIGSCCYISESLESPIYPLTPYFIGNGKKASVNFHLKDVSKKLKQAYDCVERLSHNKKGHTVRPLVPHIRECGKAYAN